AAELAVGGELQADPFLKRKRVLDGLVLGGGERRPVDLAAGKSAALLEQDRRAQQAADMLGPKGRVGLGEQGSSLGGPPEGNCCLPWRQSPAVFLTCCPCGFRRKRGLAGKFCRPTTLISHALAGFCLPRRLTPPVTMWN